MTAQILDGKALAAEIRAEVKAKVDARVAAGKRVPGLATVLVGENPASQSYVRSKRKSSAEVGIESFGYELPETASQEEVEKLVRELNADPKVNGILVQLPLPAHLDEERVLSLISIEKDVDGFHPINIGRLAQKGRDPLFVPCTPEGCIYMIQKSVPKIEGINAVVLGRSNIVGMPVALLLVRANATVTICHSRTKDLAEKVRQADIVVAAIGKAEMIKGSWIKPGAVVIDVGMNRTASGLKGDVEYGEAYGRAGLITPVPGGVGPMTRAMLLENTMIAAKRHMK